jgi:hypothetical protein
MYISFRESCAGGFKKWSDAHLATGNEHDAGDIPNGAAVSVRKSEIDKVMAALTKGSLPHRQLAGIDNPL